MTDERRRKLHDINAYIIPITFAALVGVGGYIGVQTIINGQDITRVATVQKGVVTKVDNIMEIVSENGTKLDMHISDCNFGSKANSIRHHQRDGITPCNGCHKR